VSEGTTSALSSVNGDAGPNFEVFRQSGGSSPGSTWKTTVVTDMEYPSRRLDYLSGSLQIQADSLRSNFAFIRRDPEVSLTLYDLWEHPLDTVDSNRS
jgi:hypothetical protein